MQHHLQDHIKSVGQYNKIHTSSLDLPAPIRVCGRKENPIQHHSHAGSYSLPQGIEKSGHAHTLGYVQNFRQNQLGIHERGYRNIFLP